jgi:carbonic anhydrase/acetyltransferase-like protein (isoleucine patch superfamily)
MRKPETRNISHWPKWLVETLAPIYLITIFGFPLLLVLGFYEMLSSTWLRLIVVFVGPVFCATSFMLVAGLLSIPHHQGIIPGRFPRDSGHVVYGHRKLYGLCWTALYYFKPIYWICLTFPALKKVTFRRFGYKGNVDFAVYPDTWIRDLPLLNIGKGAYLSNRATLGSNMIMPDNKIVVTPIVIGEGSIIGHLACIAGVRVDKNVVVGIGSTVGSHVHLQDGSQIGPCGGIDHGTVVGKKGPDRLPHNTGLGSSIGENCHIEANSAIRARTHVATTVALSINSNTPTADVGPPAEDLLADEGKDVAPAVIAQELQIAIS